jgi:hypothetical protein
MLMALPPAGDEVQPLTLGSLTELQRSLYLATQVGGWGGGGRGSLLDSMSVSTVRATLISGKQLRYELLPFSLCRFFSAATPASLVPTVMPAVFQVHGHVAPHAARLPA